MTKHAFAGRPTQLHNATSSYASNLRTVTAVQYVQASGRQLDWINNTVTSIVTTSECASRNFCKP